MNENLETILICLWEYALWWVVFMFIGFCIVDAILPEKHINEEEFEERLK